MTDRIEIVSKEVDGQAFTGLRFYLELPVTIPAMSAQALDSGAALENVRGPFMHRAGDDDSSAVTFWGKRSLRAVLEKALRMLGEHEARRSHQWIGQRRRPADEGWSDWVRYCEVCGLEDPGEEGVPICPGPSRVIGG